MKKLLALFVGVLVFCTAAFAVESEGWLSDYQEGLAVAKKENKNMMVLFTGSDWCIWCKRLQAEILQKEEFTQFAKDNLVLVELDFPSKNKPSEEVQAVRKTLASKYKIKGYPTLVLLTPEENEFGRMGYMKDGATAFVAEYKKLAALASTVKSIPATKLVAPKVNSATFAFEVSVDYKEVPEMEGWMKAMQSLCREWYPKLIDELNSPGFKPYPKVSVVLRPDPKGVAATGGANIHLSKEYFSKNGTDTGAVIHELVHVVQAYPKYIPWITEGIADYIRLYKFEPNAPRPKIDPETASLEGGYKVVAAFLAWLVETKDADIIAKLNISLRQGTYSDEIFKELLGGTKDELFAEFLKLLKK